MLQFYTYLHSRPAGTPFYVGKGKGDRATLFDCRNAHHKNIVAKYGQENIDIFIFPRRSERDALETECRWIAQFKREGIALCNQTDGGEGVSGLAHSDETRAKLSAANMGKKHTVESKAKISAALMGRALSPETRAKMSAAQTGKVRSPEYMQTLVPHALGKSILLNSCNRKECCYEFGND